MQTSRYSIIITIIQNIDDDNLLQQPEVRAESFSCPAYANLPERLVIHQELTINTG